MNPLTTIRDLVYQSRFTESLRLAQYCRELGLPYIKAHSGNLKSPRKVRWLDDGLAHLHTIAAYGIWSPRGNGRGKGWGYSKGNGYGYEDTHYYNSGDGLVYRYSQTKEYFHKYIVPRTSKCPWKRI